jgi:hypothetical protein
VAYEHSEARGAGPCPTWVVPIRAVVSAERRLNGGFGRMIGFALSPKRFRRSPGRIGSCAKGWGVAHIAGAICRVGGVDHGSDV